MFVGGIVDEIDGRWGRYVGDLKEEDRVVAACKYTGLFRGNLVMISLLSCIRQDVPERADARKSPSSQ